MMKFVDDIVKEGERYTIEGSYITNPSQGHLISVFRKDGKLIYYDELIICSSIIQLQILLWRRNNDEGNKNLRINKRAAG